MDNPLIFGYQLGGVKTFYMTRGVFGLRSVGCLRYPRRKAGMGPCGFQGGSIFIHAAKKSVERSCLIARTGIRHR